MAITAILLTIIVVPVIQSVNLVNLGSAYNQAQENARIELDKISREISNSAGIRDNSGDAGSVAVEVPTGPGSINPTTTVLLPYSKLDIVNFAQGQPGGPGVFINPTTGKIDPTLIAPKGQVNLPVAPGTTITRYYIALRAPLGAGSAVINPYYNPYNGLLMAMGGGQDNLYVLYRATVNPFVWVQDPVTKVWSYQPNTNFFATDVNGNIILDDPYFMIPDGTAAKATRIQNWLNASVIQTQVSRFDMIAPIYNRQTRLVDYIFNGAGDYIPQLISLLQFRADQQSTEPATAMTALKLGNENDEMTAVGADVFRTKFGSWSQPVINVNQNFTNTVVSIQDLKRSDGSVGFSEYFNGTELFDVSDYMGLASAGTRYPFSLSLQATLNRINWLPGGGQNLANFEPMWFDSSAGKIYGSFPISDVGLNALPPNPQDPTGSRPNQPLVGAGTQTTPFTNADLGAVYGGAGFTINDAFNKAYSLVASSTTTADQTVNVKRIIDLRVTPNEDGTYGPLYPTGATNMPGTNVVVSNNANGFPRASIVPGSDVVYGPDQNPGPNYGNLVRYTRITQGNPGPDQYRINYANAVLPSNFNSYFTAAELTGFNPNVYDPTNIVSAVFQPQYMAGCIVLNSDPTQPLPNTVPFKVYYRFQFTQSTDAVSVDYQSRQIMHLLLTISTYPQAANEPNPQMVTLETTATVRNFLRS